MTRHSDRLGGAEEALFELDLDGVAEVRPAPSPASASPARRIPEAEEVAEDVRKISERGGIESGGPGDPGMTVGVVSTPLVGIGEDTVGLGGLLEAILRRLVSGVSVGMELHRDLPVGGLDLGVGAAPRHLEDFVVIAGHVLRA